MRELMSTTEELFAAAIEAMPESVSASLRRPARSGAIRVVNERIEAQRSVGEIPGDMAALWSMHDGQREGADVFPEFAFLPIGQAISEYSELCYLQSEIDAAEADGYPPEKEFWENWYDPVLFPIGWTPGGSGCLFLIHIENGRIYRFNPDGGIGSCCYQSVHELLARTAEHHKAER